MVHLGMVLFNAYAHHEPVTNGHIDECSKLIGMEIGIQVVPKAQIGH